MHRFNRRMQDFDPWDPAKLNISGATLLAIANLTEVRTSTRQYHPCPRVLTITNLTRLPCSRRCAWVRTTTPLHTCTAWMCV